MSLEKLEGILSALVTPLTKNYELDEENVSFLKEHYEEESRDGAAEEIVTFFDTRRTKFVDYEKVKI